MMNIWWNQVTNAVQYVSEIKKSLLEEKSILLKYSSSMPWRECFEDSVKEAVKLQNSEKKFVEVPAVTNPGEYLLNEFCKKEKRAEYRPSKGYSKFFAESEDIVLHDRYLWIEIDDEECLEKWLSFASEYIKERGKNSNRAVFILEWAEEGQVSVKKGIKVYSFDDYIGEYDRLAFAVLASSSIKEDIFLKNYLVELAINTTGNDIELCSECVMGYKEFLRNPHGYIKTVLESKVRSDGSEYSYEMTQDEVNHLIWLAQIKTIYPHLEEYREEFVQRHANAISRQLPIQAPYGEIYSDPKDVELGTLIYMAGSGSLVLNQNEYEKLKRFKEARNKLSHLATLTFEEIKQLL